MVEAPDDKPIVGTCLQMCPAAEIERRVRTKRLNRLEATRESLKERTLVADPNRAVKEFERTAMGSRKIDTSQIRPVAVLDQTVTYLVDKILPLKSLPYNLVYDFVFDRFRAVRQELVMQQVAGVPKIRMLEKMVLFHVYSAFIMCELEYRCFDPVINRQHLSECLNILMSQFDMQQTDEEAEERSEWGSGVASRAVFETIYLLHNLPSDRAIARYGSLPPAVAANPTARQAFQLATAFQTGNYYKVLKLLPELPVFSLMSVSPHIPVIQLNYMKILNSAFSGPSPALTVPLRYLTRVLCPFENGEAAEPHVLFLCQQFDARAGRSAVRFIKSNKDSAAVLRSIPHRMWSLLEKRVIHENIRDLINFVVEGDSHSSSSSSFSL